MCRPSPGRPLTKSENEIIQICEYLDLNENIQLKILNHYNEPHRYYHTCDHIADIIEQIDDCEKIRFSDENDKMYYATLFHDIIYDPRSKTNEDDSIKLMYDLLKAEEPIEFLDEIAHYISATKYDSNELDEQQKLFCKFDLNGFERSFREVLLNAKKIEKEYQWVDWDIYSKGRIEVLEKFRNNPLLTDVAKRNIEFEIEYCKFHQPNIAVYPGSFAPFHLGHLNILNKAEKIFDKVIIAVGKNPEKTQKEGFYHESLKDNFKYHQVDFYNGLLTDYLKTKSYPLTVIRGLRNTIDLQAELNQYRWLQEMSNNEIKVVSIFCDKEYEHISSSALRSIKQYGHDEKYII